MVNVGFTLSGLSIKSSACAIMEMSHNLCEPPLVDTNMVVDSFLSLDLESHRLSVVLSGPQTRENIHTHNSGFVLWAMSSLKISLPFHRFIATAFCWTEIVIVSRLLMFKVTNSTRWCLGEARLNGTWNGLSFLSASTLIFRVSLFRC